MKPNVSVPAAIPTIEAGMRIRSSGHSHLPRYAQRPTRSMRQRMGSNTAAACNGDTTKAMSGTASTPSPPPKPPFAIPNSSTAGMAAT
jgi:hypothetical protein